MLSIDRHKKHFPNSAPSRDACFRRYTLKWQWDVGRDGVSESSSLFDHMNTSSNILTKIKFPSMILHC